MVGQAARRYLVSDPDDVMDAARALAAGRFVVHPFANIYGLSSRGDVLTVQAVNAFKGRPMSQVGSVTTTPARLTALFDLDRLHPALRMDDVLCVMDDLLCLGPFELRGPAGNHIPDHLTVRNKSGRWVQAIVPGYRCPANAFVSRCLHLCGADHLHITSANRSRHQTGSREEPAHYRAAPLRDEFDADPRLVILEHDEEEAAVRAYPGHAPMSTSVLAFAPPRGASGPAVTLERHGSLPVEQVRSVVGALRHRALDLRRTAAAAAAGVSHDRLTMCIDQPLGASDAAT